MEARPGLLAMAATAARASMAGLVVPAGLAGGLSATAVMAETVVLAMPLSTPALAERAVTAAREDSYLATEEPVGLAAMGHRYRMA